jgi:hypothetical protein
MSKSVSVFMFIFMCKFCHAYLNGKISPLFSALATFQLYKLILPEKSTDKFPSDFFENNMLTVALVLHIEI